MCGQWPYPVSKGVVRMRTELAQRMISLAGSKQDDLQMGAISSIANDIRLAQKFVLSPDVLEAAERLANSKPRSLLDAIALCALPHDRMWIEFAYHYQMSPRDNQSLKQAERMGLLVRSMDEDNKRFSVAFNWTFKDDPMVRVCPIGVLVNWSDGWKPLPTVFSASKRLIEADPEFMALDDVNREAMVLLESRQAIALSPYSRKIWEHLERTQPAETARAGQAYVDSIRGDVQLLQAVICLLNSRNCIGLTRGVMPERKGNSARVSRKGFRGLSYSTVTINLSRRDSDAAAADGMSAGEIRKHIVRGHFKIRKGGVYWWRPFIRGKAEFGEVKRVGYRVVDRPVAEAA